jgi:hydrogenase maturation protein HypF
LIRQRIEVRGVVQGVGFRPFVHHLAQQLRLTGYVLNTSDGVLIEVEGSDAALARFLFLLTQDPPPLALIDGITVKQLEAGGDPSFVIRESVETPDKLTLVSPDVGTCEECRRECLDTRDRRYGYPFTNCTNCGPRYTIIRDIPYDRPLTTMAKFPLCPTCQAEYDDPANRRFHAQPNACPDCGPTLALAPGDAFLLDEQLLSGAGQNPLAVLRKTRHVLREGGIVAIKGLGGFHLACDATNDAAVQRLRERKRRNDKPFALMARDLAMVERLSAQRRRPIAAPWRIRGGPS